MELREKDTRKVVAALKCCANDLADCADCYLFGEDRCRKVLVSDAMEHIEELEKEVEYFAEHRGYEWISVEDRLPEEKDMVLTFAMDKNHLFAFLSDDENWYNSNGFLELNITHWMPLPAPPKPKVPTFKEVFLKKFPKADIEDGDDGNSPVCRNAVFFGSALCTQFPICYECWNQPYFEKEGGEE